MRKQVGHIGSVPIALDSLPPIGMSLTVGLRCPYPKRYLKLLASQSEGNLRRVQSSVELIRRIETLLTMIGHINDDSILLLVTTNDGIYHRVIVSGGIVVVSQTRQLGLV